MTVENSTPSYKFEIASLCRYLSDYDDKPEPDDPFLPCCALRQMQSIFADSAFQGKDREELKTIQSKLIDETNNGLVGKKIGDMSESLRADADTFISYMIRLIPNFEKAVNCKKLNPLVLNTISVCPNREDETHKKVLQAVFSHLCGMCQVELIDTAIKLGAEVAPVNTHHHPLFFLVKDPARTVKRPRFYETLQKLILNGLRPADILPLPQNRMRERFIRYKHIGQEFGKIPAAITQLLIDAAGGINSFILYQNHTDQNGAVLYYDERANYTTYMQAMQLLDIPLIRLVSHNGINPPTFEEMGAIADDSIDEAPTSRSILRSSQNEVLLAEKQAKSTFLKVQTVVFHHFYMPLIMPYFPPEVALLVIDGFIDSDTTKIMDISPSVIAQLCRDQELAERPLDIVSEYLDEHEKPAKTRQVLFNVLSNQTHPLNYLKGIAKSKLPVEVQRDIMSREKGGLFTRTVFDSFRAKRFQRMLDQFQKSYSLE